MCLNLMVCGIAFVAVTNVPVPTTETFGFDSYFKYHCLSVCRSTYLLFCCLFFPSSLSACFVPFATKLYITYICICVCVCH